MKKSKLFYFKYRPAVRELVKACVTCFFAIVCCYAILSAYDLFPVLDTLSTDNPVFFVGVIIGFGVACFYFAFFKLLCMIYYFIKIKKSGCPNKE